MRSFLKFFVVWVSQNLAIPFWMVGHVHLSLTDYHADFEMLCSLLLHTIVGIGFVIDYRMNGSATQTLNFCDNKLICTFL